MKDELKPIVEGLLKKSEVNQVAWAHASTVGAFRDAEIEQSAEDYAVSTPSYTINLFRVSQRIDSEHKVGIRFNILNEVGELVTGDTLYKDEPEYPVLENLLDLARKHVAS